LVLRGQRDYLGRADRVHLQRLTQRQLPVKRAHGG
jgi:hypothetical protein